MPVNLPLPVILMVLLFAAAVGGALFVLVTERQRRAVIRRASGGLEGGASIYRTPASTERGVLARLGDFLGARIPVQFGTDTAIASKLVQAGFDTPGAPALFMLIRIACAVTFPVLGLLLVPRGDITYFVIGWFLVLVLGFLGPQAALDSITTRRQDVIRKGVPDSLDLLVVCVEAGVALDAAIQRVAREMSMLHPILAEELVGMSRRVSAGMPREQALQGLYLRTGLDELRGLASHMLQSEKWGTSIANVLRVYADQLRRKRKMAAEKRAATASTRMLIPLALFIFPTIFIVLLGPAAINISKMFKTMGQ
ncbi:MAG: type II secretion system F family protein [Gemmatimonadota bacterium]